MTMKHLEPRVERVTITGDRLADGPTVYSDDRNGLYREGHTVGVILAKDTLDDDNYHVEFLVGNLDQLLTDGPETLRSEYEKLADKGEILAANATLRAEFGDTADEDTLRFVDVDVRRHEATMPPLA